LATPLHKPQTPQKYAQPQRRLRAVQGRKKNAGDLRRFVQLIFLGLLGIFVMPVMYFDFLRPIFLNRYLYSSIQLEKIPYQPLKNKLDKALPVSELYFMPATKTVYNSTLLNQPILTKAPEYSEMSPIKVSSPMLALNSDLKNLAAKYPHLKPSIFVWDFATAQYADLNADETIPAASIIKIPVLYELFRQIESGNKDIKDTMLFEELYRSSGSGVMLNLQSDVNYTLDELANLMITESDNTATNMLLAETGGMVGLNRSLRNWGMAKTRINNWLPDLEGKNITTANEIATILYNLDSPSFFNLQSKEYIVDYMSRVKNIHLIRAGLGKGAAIVHKTGDIGGMLGDAGVVYTPSGNKYIAVIMVKRPHNDPSARNFIVEASSIIYRHFEPMPLER